MKAGLWIESWANSKELKLTLPYMLCHVGLYGRNVLLTLCVDPERVRDLVSLSYQPTLHVISQRVITLTTDMLRLIQEEKQTVGKVQ